MLSEQQTTTPLTKQQSRSLTKAQLQGWRSFLRAHAAITRQLDADLIAGHGLSLSEYEVLLRLAQAPERQMRLIRLSEQVVLTRSGITRLVTRLEKQRLVERVCSPEDRRGYNARLTEAGYQRLCEAAPTHRDGIRRLFVEPLGADLEVLSETLRHLTGERTLGTPAAPDHTPRVNSGSSVGVRAVIPDA
jgi:DNA-binding MarR family transcriptional regulator